jgi:hypothetical protein
MPAEVRVTDISAVRPGDPGCKHILVSADITIDGQTVTLRRGFTQQELFERLRLTRDEVDEAWTILLHLMRHTAATAGGTLANQVAAVKREVYRL